MNKISFSPDHLLRLAAWYADEQASLKAIHDERLKNHGGEEPLRGRETQLPLVRQPPPKIKAREFLGRKPPEVKPLPKPKPLGDPLDAPQIPRVGYLKTPGRYVNQTGPAKLGSAYEQLWEEAELFRPVSHQQPLLSARSSREPNSQTSSSQVLPTASLKKIHTDVEVPDLVQNYAHGEESLTDLRTRLLLKPNPPDNFATLGVVHTRYTRCLATIAMRLLAGLLHHKLQKTFADVPSEWARASLDPDFPQFFSLPRDWERERDKCLVTDAELAGRAGGPLQV